MVAMIFWEKPGCSGNARQKAALRAGGHALEVRDLRTEPWTPARLRPFFGDRPVTEWFNRRAPAIAAGAIRPESLTEADALALMIADPLLIRRPLIAVAGRSECGFEPTRLAALIGAALPAGVAVEDCPRSAGAARCG